MDAIVAQIRDLSGAERRRLYRRLLINGLMNVDAPATDRNPLGIAPSVPQRRARALPSSPASAQSAPQPGDETYRSPVRGRVVVGAPESAPEMPPLAMQPLPGQAPEQPIRIIFDGGSKGNPGKGYGSYALEWPGYPRQLVRLRFGDQVTNNEAEYDTLIAAVEAALKRLVEQGVDPAGARLEIWGDSQLVINQINGEWESKKAEMRLRRDQALALLSRFGAYHLRYHSRDNNVDILGH